jgi:hypothetical protein
MYMGFECPYIAKSVLVIFDRSRVSPTGSGQISVGCEVDEVGWLIKSWSTTLRCEGVQGNVQYAVVDYAAMDGQNDKILTAQE